MSLERLGSALRSLVTRGRVQSATVGARTLMQISGLAGETASQVELLLPPGMTANIARGNDVVVLQVGGSRDHLVALGGDTVGSKVSGLASGEIAFSVGETQIIWRVTGKLEVKAPVEVDITAPTVKITGNLLVTGDITDQSVTQSATLAGLRETYGEHTHNVSGSITAAPNQQIL